MLTDAQLLALNVLEEAGGEPDDGKAAIARVVLNRQRLRYASDGTVAGTVLRKDQFSWAYFSFIGGKYSRCCDNTFQAGMRAVALFNAAPGGALTHCSIIAQQVVAGTYRGPLYSLLTDDAVLYLNPKILTNLPNWAIPLNQVCSIGHHDFYCDKPVVEPLIA